MQISFFSTKGGTGKSTSAVTLLSAAAAKNARAADDDRVEVLVLDADPQASLSKFFRKRDDHGRDRYGITCQQIHPDASTEDLARLAAGWELVIVDMPGHYSDNLLAFALQSDTIIIPSNLRLVESLETTKVVNQIMQLREEHDIPAQVAILFTRLERQWAFLPKHLKELYRVLRESGYPILDARLTDQNAIACIIDFGKFIFEQIADGDAGASAKRAEVEANTLFEAALAYRVLPRPAADAPA